MDIIKNENYVCENVKFGEMSNVRFSSFEGNNFIGQGATCVYSSLGKYSYISKNSVVKNTDIGKFTSIAWNCSIGPEEHDFSRLTSHSILTSTKTFQMFDKKFYNPFEKECKIGNDVWIGANSTILRGVTIPDGCVVGANTVVKKSPPPYTIVVGNPGKVIKFRFEKKVIDELLEVKWWNYDDSIIKSLSFIFEKKKIDLDAVNQLKSILKMEY